MEKNEQIKLQNYVDQASNALLTVSNKLGMSALSDIKCATHMLAIALATKYDGSVHIETGKPMTRKEIEGVEKEAIDNLLRFTSANYDFVEKERKVSHGYKNKKSN